VIQASINALPNGGKILIKAGTYIISDVITPKAYQTIAGEGRATILKLANNVSKNIIEFAAPGGADIPGWTIRDIALDGNRLNQTGVGTDRYQNCIYTQHCTNFTIKNVYVTGAFYSGLAINHATRATVENVIAYDNGDSGVLITGAGDSYVNDQCTFKNIKAYSNGRGTQAGASFAGVVLINTLRSELDAIAYDNGHGTDGRNFVIDRVESSRLKLISYNANANKGVEFRGSCAYLDAEIIIKQDNTGAHGIISYSTTVSLKYSKLKIIAIDCYNYFLALNCTAYYNDISGMFINTKPLAGANLVYLATDAKYNRIHDSIFMDLSSPLSRPRAILEDTGGDYNQVFDCYFGSFTVTPVQFTGANSRAKRNVGYVTENGGTATFSGNGSTTTFTIAHGLAGTPKSWRVEAGSSDAKGDKYVTADATNLTVTFATAPPAGTNNVVLVWQAEM
jgi:hypothetical protein